MSENKWISQGEITKRYYLSTGSNSPFYNASVTFNSKDEPTEIIYSSGSVTGPIMIGIESLKRINDLLAKIERKEV